MQRSLGRSTLSLCSRIHPRSTVQQSMNTVCHTMLIEVIALRCCDVAVAGNSGQGMTGGTISAMVIADQILGRSNPWRHAYSPQRLPPASGQVLQSAALVVQDTVQVRSLRRPLFKSTVPFTQDAFVAPPLMSGTRSRCAHSRGPLLHSHSCAGHRPGTHAVHSLYLEQGVVYPDTPPVHHMDGVPWVHCPCTRYTHSTLSKGSASSFHRVYPGYAPFLHRVLPAHGTPGVYLVPSLWSVSLRCRATWRIFPLWATIGRRCGS